MSEPILIQQQRAIWRALRQATTQHAQITTAADAEWQKVQRAYWEPLERQVRATHEEAAWPRCWPRRCTTRHKNWPNSPD